MIKKSALLLIILIAVLCLIISYLWLEIRNVKQQAVLPVFSQQYSKVAGGDEWELKNFQPTVKGFFTENDQNLILVEFSDQNNQRKKAKLFVSGKTPSGYQVEKAIFVPVKGQVEKLDFNELKNRLKKGNQIRAEYINSVPEPKNTDDCRQQPENFQDLCFLTDVLAAQKISSIEELLKQGEDQSILVPVTFISLELYEE